MAIDRSAIVSYANTYWYQPCKDGKAWLANEPVIIANEISKRKLSSADWTGAFLGYDGQSKPDTAGTRTRWLLEGLYLIKRSDAGKLLSDRKASSYPGAIMLASWYDNRSDDSLTNPPPYNGLNDCAHFVTECLAAGGAPGLRTVSVPNLLNSLTAHSETKTLAKFTNQANAQRIMDAGLLKEGDVLIFSKTVNKHGHSTIYLGGGKMAMHTYANHPNCPERGGGAWTGSMTAEHNLVTLIHWDAGDTYGTASDSLLGYWSVLWRGKVYYYYFGKGGRVSYSKTKPGNLKSPPNTADGRGYWFESTFGIDIAWTATGSLEQFIRPTMFTSNAMAGTWNGSEPLVATRL